jgi:hypothetical protein
VRQLRADHVELAEQRGIGERDVAFGIFGGEFDGAAGLAFGLGHQLVSLGEVVAGHGDHAHGACAGGMSGGIGGIERGGAGELGQRGHVARLVDRVLEQELAAQVGVIGCRDRGSAAALDRFLVAAGGQLRGERGIDSLGDFFLQAQDVAGWTLVSLRPLGKAGCGLDQFDRDAHFARRHADIAGEQVGHAKLRGDAFRVSRLAPKLVRRYLPDYGE